MSSVKKAIPWRDAVKDAISLYDYIDISKEVDHIVSRHLI